MDLLWALAFSSHLGLNGDYNSVHPHIRFFEDGEIAGAYYNSEERISFYGGYRLEPLDNLGLELGLVTGYPSFGAIAPYGRATYDLGNTRFFVAPGAEVRHNETKTGAVIGVEFIIAK